MIHYLATPLVHILNLSLSSVIVPNKMKIGKIIPVYKKGDKHLFSHFFIDLLLYYHAFLKY